MNVLDGIRSDPVKVPHRRGARTAASLVAALTLAVGLTGCGGSTTADPQSSTAGNSSNDKSEALVKYAQCMRSHGVPSFPDPQGGRLQIKAHKGGPLDPSSPQFQAAEKACKSMEPPGLSKGPARSGKQEDALLKFVSCMRSHGVPKFPDPDGGKIKLNPGSGVDPNSPQFQKAQETCRKLLPGGVAPGGQ